MKKRFFTLAAAALLMAAGSAYLAAEAPKKELVTGTLKCLHCYASGAELGEHPEAAMARCVTKNGMPPVIVQEGTDEVFVVVLKNGVAAGPKHQDLMGKKINAQGPVYRKKGVNVLEALVVAEAI